MSFDSIRYHSTLSTLFKEVESSPRPKSVTSVQLLNPLTQDSLHWPQAGKKNVGLISFNFLFPETCSYFYRLLKDASQDPRQSHVLQQVFSAVPGLVKRWNQKPARTSGSRSYRKTSLSNFFHVVLLLTSRKEISITSSIKWSNMLGRLISIRARHTSLMAYFQTLGGAYATLREAPKALSFAIGLLKIAKEEEDRILDIRSRIFITSAQLQLGTPPSEIRHRLGRLRAHALKLQNDEVNGLINFSFLRLEQKIAADAKK